VNNDEVWILGIHMTQFGRHRDKDAVDLAAEAAMAALTDAGVSMADIGVIASGNLMDGPRSFGQQVQKQIGQTGVPLYNVANACATGATALRTALMAIRAGDAEIGLAFGAEKLSGAGLLGGTARTVADEWQPTGRFGQVMSLDGVVGTESMPALFAQLGMKYLHDQGYADSPLELFARISAKNHAHSTLNPLATYSRRMSVEQIMNDPMVAYPHTRSMCSANCDGAAAAVLVSGERLASLSADQRHRAVKISASVITTDPWTDGNQVLPDINTLTRNAASKAYETAGVSPDDLDLVELHDCFAAGELVHYENLALCEEGGAIDLFQSGATWRDGRIPVNVSGGLESKGHPIAATGIANIWEICHHLRGEAGDRQIPDARVGLAHVLGLGSTCGVHILERAAA
jgi:acetyl-CoA acetyltransferase